MEHSRSRSLSAEARRRRLARALCAGPVVALAARAPAQATFQALGLNPAGGQSFGHSVSLDGTTVVGVDGGRAFRWTQATGRQDLGELSPNRGSIAWAVSADGSVVVGEARATSGAVHAFRWTAQTGMVDIGLPPGQIQAWATAVSADGSVVSGYGEVNPTSVFRWSATEGFLLLGTLPGGTGSGVASLSADGLTIVGYADSSVGGRAFRWTAAEGMVSLGVLPGYTWSRADDVSADGSVIVGQLSAGQTDTTFRWTAQTGMQVLGPIGSAGTECAISGDGRVIIGRIGESASIWTSSRGRLDFTAFLGEAVPPGWRSLAPMDLSGDGLRIAGWGYNPAGVQEAWLVTLTPDLLVCYPNCDAMAMPPILSVNDFICFQAKFAAGDSYANCDGSTAPPVLNINDFLCFMGRFAAGCN